MATLAGPEQSQRAGRAVRGSAAGAAGFTLVEVMVVVGIMGVMAVLAGPDIATAIQHQRAISAEKEVEDAVRRARNFARLTLCEVQVTTTQPDGDGRWVITYETTETDSTEPCWSAGDYDADEHLQFREKFKSSVTLSGFAVSGVATPSFKFNKKGGTDYAGEGKLTVSSTAGTTRIIEVWPAIGTIQVVY